MPLTVRPKTPKSHRRDAGATPVLGRTVIRFLVFPLCIGLITPGLHAGDQTEVWYMNEEWYDWHPWSAFRSDEPGVVSVEVHFVGPGAPTPRSIYVRANADAPIEQIRVLSIKDHRGEPLKTEPVAIEAEGAPAGKKWVRLATGSFRRGYEPLALKLPGNLAAKSPVFDYLCLSPNERYITDGRAERWIRDHEKSKEVRCGMPLGGIGAGKIEIARDGRLRNITTNNNIDAPFYHPDHCFLAASIAKTPRILRDEAGIGLEPVDRIRFEARYPIARLTFSDDDWPVDVQLIAWSPLVPYNVKDSCLPVALFEFNITNHTEQPLSAAVALSWDNLLGSTGRPQPINTWGKTGHYYRCREHAGNRQQTIEHPRFAGIVFTGGDKKDRDAEGNYAIVKTRPSTECLPGYEPDPARHDPLTRGDIFPEFADSTTRSVPGAVVGHIPPVDLQPGKTATVRIALAWYMDHFYQMGKEDLGHYYHNHFKSAEDVAQYVLDNYDRLFAETKALHDLFDRSDLPAWFADTLLNDLYVLSTDTWLTRDGRFSVNEGATNMYGVMGTMDQKLYASHHLALLFPSLQEQELRQFGELQNDNGGITHDLGTGEFVAKNKAFDWPDLNSAFSILSWQVYRYTGDEGFWKEMRPRVLKALECLATAWDPDDTGVPGRGSTFDDEDSYRVFSYTTGLYLCDLKLGMAIARQMGDDALAAKFEKRFDRARDLAMKELWTGEYFRYGSSPPPENKRTDASHFSQMAGEFWARLLGFDGIYEPQVRNKALASTLRLHWNDNFKLPPKIVLPDGTLFPRDGEHRNAPVSWPMHARALMCGPAFLFGMEQAGWDLLKAMRDNIIAANGPDPWDQSLYYDPITGRYDWGVFYMTAPASWLAYQALVDAHYDAVTQTLTLRPQAVAKVSPGKFPIITPVFWAMGEASRDGRRLAVSVERLLAESVRVQALALADGLRVAAVRIDGQPVEAIMREKTLILDRPLALEAGRRIELELEPE